MADFIPSDGWNDRNVILGKQMFQNIFFNPFNASCPHIIYAIDNSHATSGDPIPLHAMAAASSQMTHNALSSTKGSLFYQRKSLFAGQPNTAVKFGIDFPRLELAINTFPRPGDN